VVRMSKSLGMATTAEGVETSAQLSHLRAEGCAEVQGFLFSVPRPAGDVPLLLRQIDHDITSAA
jgi:EAL domain-containing protein (putative c-di-GMP-specific phosphodiesterase class I)